MPLGIIAGGLGGRNVAGNGGRVARLGGFFGGLRGRLGLGCGDLGAGMRLSDGISRTGRIPGNPGLVVAEAMLILHGTHGAGLGAVGVGEQRRGRRLKARTFGKILGQTEQTHQASPTEQHHAEYHERGTHRYHYDYCGLTGHGRDATKLVNGANPWYARTGSSIMPPSPRLAQATALFDRLSANLLDDLHGNIRWFYERMPEAYFRLTPVDEQARHVELLQSLRRSPEPRLTAIDDPACASLQVVGSPAHHPLRAVIELARRHPVAAEVRRVDLFTATDDSLFLYVFRHGPARVPEGINLPARRQAVLDTACDHGEPCERRAKTFLDAVDPGYLARSEPPRLARHLAAWLSLAHDEDIQVTWERLARPDHGEAAATRFQLAAGAVRLWPLLSHVGRVLAHHRLTLTRGSIDWLPAPTGSGHALIATLYTVTTDGTAPIGRIAEAVASDLRAVAAAIDDPLAALYADGAIGLEELALVRACAACAATIAGPDVPYLDLAETASEAITAHPATLAAIATLISDRFRPGSRVSGRAWATRYAQVAAQVAALEPRHHALIGEWTLKVAAAVRLTNAFRPGRLGLALRLDPALLPVTRFPQLPYGMIWLHGPHARGVHIRFRASARGGLRLLLPRSPAAWGKARDGILREVYDLAWAQQLKNKDIPEGGSKCIALVEAGADPDAAVKQITDGLMDLIAPVAEVIGPHGQARSPDLLFLGPDENMTPTRIIWVAERAKLRGMPHAATFMSSKPGSGINHKEFGVTSEGIFRWVVRALDLVGIEATASYTVKITGGPDGDVGGNLLRIMHRDHGDRCQVVAIGDGTGAAHDPAGLDWRELLRLVSEAKGIAAFNPLRLKGAGAKVVAATDRAGEAYRNDLHNLVTADLFVPCGGRPYTIDEGNWGRFMTATGAPSAKAMVEGANIFITAEARRRLEDAGLVVIKDSSANKGGVICSSYEVLAGLVCDDDEFLAMKTRYVSEVVDIIRAVVEAEAEGLIAAWHRRRGRARLSELSAEFSAEINRVSGLIEGAIGERLDDRALAAHWNHHLRGHCPAVLVERFADRFTARIPRAHRVAILAKRLASRLVYQEGLTWCQTWLTADRSWEALSAWLSADHDARTWAANIDGLKLKDGKRLASAIRTGVARELVRQKLGR